MAEGIMTPVNLGAMVVVNANGQRGQVVGIYKQLDGATSFRVCYADRNGVLQEKWMAGQEFALSAPDA